MSATVPLQFVRSDPSGLMIACLVLAALAALVGVRADAEGGLRLAGLFLVGFLLLGGLILVS